MTCSSTDQPSQLETACGSLLNELQIIWDEVGESDTEKDKMLVELEQECLKIYRSKVDEANRCRAQLRRAIADSEAEVSAICSAMGELPVHTRQPAQRAGSLKEELKSITLQLDEMRMRKDEKLKNFLHVMEQLRSISIEIMPNECSPSKLVVDESDLSTRKLQEMCSHLELLQEQKNDQLKQIMDRLSTLNSLCSVLGADVKETLRSIDPSFYESEASKSVSNVTMEMLALTIGRLRETKLERMQKVQDLASTMLELWNLMDTPIEEQRRFHNVTRNIAASEEEITEAKSLSEDFLSSVEAEVSRLEQLKASKMKELISKKRTELEELRLRAHLVIDSELSAIESGAMDSCSVLEQIKERITAAKEEAFSRKDILERVEKWSTACEEEAWLEEYDRDENRYNAGRGAHLMLKRAEKARALVIKIPAMVDTLTAKVTQWEKGTSMGFMYDGVRLLSTLEEYAKIRQEKEEARKRQRDQKKLQEKFVAKQEAVYGSKPSPSKPQSGKKAARTLSGGAHRRLSFAGIPSQVHSAKSPRSGKKIDDLGALSCCARGLNLAGVPVKKPSYNNTLPAQPVGAPRKPFSPIPIDNIPLASPKPASFSELEENKMPNAAGLTSKSSTPTKAAAPMHVSAPPASTGLSNAAAAKRVAAEETEYSFEERRLALHFNR
ncbi:65-kDa microtubule-associated protein 3-like [Zingiber officinale]|uniref:65-kDa microtubule-associated protein 3-like n=1 Tax=Zingiber officinale TaxID=94328 RepID=UPI001C4CC6D6|nr:65-kDa microtubule-associated protein 3-like [Zingiber officinale]XP_042443349.1 65-kDa microtubule-associated protein 3-like [Zingiber officinale]